MTLDTSTIKRYKNVQGIRDGYVKKTAAELGNFVF